MQAIDIVLMDPRHDYRVSTEVSPSNISDAEEKSSNIEVFLVVTRSIQMNDDTD